MELLDSIIDRYWALRKNGDIAEDVKNTEHSSPFKDHKETLAPFLRYFLFSGTGSGLSKHPAEFLLEFHDPCKPDEWEILEHDSVVDEYWDRLVFSVRSKKGMPEGYPHNRNQTNNASIEKWTELWQGDYRGALHVRVA